MLFVSRRSIYKHMSGVDPWDISRNAHANFAGQGPVVAHPPCRCWSKLRHFVKLDANSQGREKELGLWAIGVVMRNGGVLEQPAGSKLWEAASLPVLGDMSDPFCYTIQIEQSWFGFPTPKKTWLLICGVPKRQLPEIPFRFMAKSRINFDNMNSFQRSQTPRALADWLCKVARMSWWQHNNTPGQSR